MYAKIKEFINQHKFVSTCILIFIIILSIILFSCGKNIYSNRGTIDNVREQLDRIEETKSDIDGTTDAIEESIGCLENRVGEAENSIIEASETSSKLNDIIGRCESILEEIRKHPAE